MSDFRNRPNGNYIFEANWQELYVLTKHWKSDLLFYRDDLKFLDHLIDKYFIWLSKKENIDQVREIEVSLVETDKLCSTLLLQVNKHLSHLAGLMEDPFKYDSHKFRTEHQILEDKLAGFVKTFRDNRKKVFAVTEHVIESEKLEHLIID
ncbi:hypothetical protein [Lutibacter flavus]|uniref:Uncharacterized protein n=1 Tax=Lutibacter flavus TaxID=691689 RepID=A0A238XM05_9FLAO|nr:hypothetical protein [Lutibacter flavus]SNR59493.1 hypothetical protein SAMN04488111_1909 [Lutibacter flavus]